MRIEFDDSITTRFRIYLHVNYGILPSEKVPEDIKEEAMNHFYKDVIIPALMKQTEQFVGESYTWNIEE